MTSVKVDVVSSSNDSKDDVPDFFEKFKKSWKDPRNRYYNLSVIYKYIIRPSLQEDKELSSEESICSLTMKFYPDYSSALKDPMYDESTFCSKDNIAPDKKFKSWKDPKNRHYNLSIVYEYFVSPSLQEDKELSSEESVCSIKMKFYQSYSYALNDLPDEMSTYCYGIHKGYDEILMQKDDSLAMFPDQKEVDEKTKLGNQIGKVIEDYYEPIMWTSADGHNWCIACIQIPKKKNYLQSLWLSDEGCPHSYVEKNTQGLLGLTSNNALMDAEGNAWRHNFCGDEIGSMFLRDSTTCANKGVRGINLLGNDVRFHRINFGSSLEQPYKDKKNVFFDRLKFIEYVKTFYESISKK